MTGCRYDREAEDYLTDDGLPCKRDDYGDRTKHCTARRTCSQHIGFNELCCARCIGRTRTDIAQIVERASLMLPEALVAGVDSEAACLAGPAADVEAWSWRKAAAKNWRDYGQGSWHLSLVEDDDDWHPYAILTRWEFMLREDYEMPRPTIGCRVRNIYELEGATHQGSHGACLTKHGLGCWSGSETPTNIGSAAAFLTRILHRVAQDDGQDFPLLAREMRKCRAHLESVLRDSLTPERGAPCPTCKDAGTFVRLERVYAHWCTREDCLEQFHSVTDDFDVWVCPRNREHWWTAAGYGELMDERKGA